MKKHICALPVLAAMLALLLSFPLALSSCEDSGGGSYSFERDTQSGQAGGASPGKNDKAEDSGPGGELSLLYHMQHQHAESYTEDGYYYLTLETVRLADGREARHLMYMDFASCREVYLCSNPACAHDTADCTSVFPMDQFGQSTALFVMNGSLYILSKEQDRDGSAVMGSLGGEAASEVEAMPTVLYRANADGTGREKIYAFDASVTVEDIAVGDGESLYMITKKVKTESSGGSIYHTSSERQLMRLDVSAGEGTSLFSFDFGDGIDWDIIGCTGRRLILYGIDFGREVSEEEKHAEDDSVYDGSSDVFATFDIDSGKIEEFYRVKDPKSRSFVVDGKFLYYSVSGAGRIVSVDILTAEEKTLCTTPNDSIWGTVGDRIYTRDSTDNSLSFIDTATGEISRCGLTDRSTGTCLKIIAVLNERVLLIYDSDVTPKGDGSYTVHGYKYALIDKDDLFAGIDSFMPIKMIGSGL